MLDSLKISWLLRLMGIKGKGIWVGVMGVFIVSPP